MNMKTYTILSIVKAATENDKRQLAILKNYKEKLRWCSYERNNEHIRRYSFKYCIKPTYVMLDTFNIVPIRGLCHG